MKQFTMVWLWIFSSMLAIGAVSDNAEQMQHDKDDTVVEYLAQFHFNNMGCIYRVNGMDFKGD